MKSPIYSHLTYDIVPDKFDIVDQPDILILEGLNVLQTGSNKANQTFVSDFVDFSIYVDADENLLKEWYIKRFLKFRQSAFTNPIPILNIMLISLSKKPLKQPATFGITLTD